MNSHGKHVIFAFVGPSKAGKTTLIRALAAAFPDELEEALSLTTRPQRDDDDAKTYRFVTSNVIRKKHVDGKLIQIAEYTGHLYANDRDEMDRLLRRRHALIALTEEGVENFKAAGYDLFVIRVIPVNHRPTDDAERQQADVERAKHSIRVHVELLNSFAWGGLGRAVEELTRIVKHTLAKKQSA